MKAVVFYRASADALSLAPLHFPAHKAHWDAFRSRGELLAIGPFADPRDGAMAVFRTRAAAEEFVAGDPFVHNGVVASHEIKDWNEALL